MSYEIGVESNMMKSFKVKIDGEVLTNGQVISIRMKWDIDNFKVTGKLVFLDFSNLVEDLPIRGNNTVSMAITDNDDVPSTQSFKVVNVGYTQTKDGKVLTVLDLLDPITVATTQMYNEMSWDSEHMIGIIDHPETMKPLLTGKKKDFCSPPPPHKNFCLPLHVPFNVVTHWLAKNANVKWFQNREAFVIQPIKELFGRGKKGDKFRYKTPNNAYRRRIYEIKNDFGGMLNANIFQATGKVASFDPSNKHSKWTNNDFKGALSKLSSPGKTAVDLPGTGARHYYKSDYHIDKVVDSMWEINAYKDYQLEILVPGQFATNVGDIVELDLVNKKDPNKPEANMNGLWLITEILDIIQPPDFVQKITLSRAKYSK